MPAGRPKIEIDWEKLDLLCVVQSTLAEIASYFDCSPDTIQRRIEEEKGVNFAVYFEQKRGRGKISLRRRQYQKAMEGSVPMLIWLGKQWLGQSDKIETNSREREEYETPDSLKADEETQKAD